MGKKICIMSSAHPVFDIRIFHKQAKTLASAGYEVSLIVQHTKRETIDSIDIIPLSTPQNRFQRMFGLTFSVFRLAIKEKAEIYHFHDPELLPIGVLLKLFTRKKVIYDIHENYPEDIKLKQWIPKGLRPVVAKIYATLEKVMSKFLDGVIVVNGIIEDRFDDEKAIQIRNYPILYTDYSNAKKGENNEVVVIYPGNLNKVRGIYELVKSLEYIDTDKKIKLVLYGKFASSKFEEEIRDLKGFSRVDYRGIVDHHTVWDNLMKSDIGVILFHPSSHSIGALPNKIFEYMSAGLPVISSNFSFWEDIVIGNNCGVMVDPQNSEEVAKAIEYLAENPKLRKQMGINGREAVLKKYTWENEGKRLVAFYEKILGHS